MTHRKYAAYFVLTIDPLWPHAKQAMRILDDIAEYRWITPFVAVGGIKYTDTELTEVFRNIEGATWSGSSLTIVDEDGEECWSNCSRVHEEAYRN